MQDDPTALLKKHGKSFNFARLFLGSETGIAAARLYGFCRIIDDIADESLDKEQAKKQLTDLHHAILQNQTEHPLVGDFLQLCEEYNIDKNNGITLIQGVSEDLHQQALETEQQIVNYAYKVAGVVGLMMAPILGTKQEGYPFAVDLGIGMQLTNIARDIMEDANMERRYIPGEWVDGLSAKQIALAELGDRQKIQHAIVKLLSLAEEYYQSGLAGLYYLPDGNKRAIAVAAYVYRQIGRELLKQDCQYWRGRVYIQVLQKIVLAVQALWHLRTKKFAEKAVKHRSELHTYLIDSEYISRNYLDENIEAEVKAL
jgi:phytoene synthase